MYLATVFNRKPDNFLDKVDIYYSFMHDVKVFYFSCYPSGTKHWKFESLSLDFGLR